MESGSPSSSGQRRRSQTSRLVKHDSFLRPGQSKAVAIGAESWSPSASGSSLDESNVKQVRQATGSTSNHVSYVVPHTPTSPRQAKDKNRAKGSISSYSPPNSISPSFQHGHSPLGPDMLSSSSYKSINLNSHFSSEDSDEPARLITYTKHSQGFTWNDELFLPSYLVNRHRYSNGRRRHRGHDDDDDEYMDDDTTGDFNEQGEKCPVTDIFVTDEEAAAMMP